MTTMCCQLGAGTDITLQAINDLDKAVDALASKVVAPPSSGSSAALSAPDPPAGLTAVIVAYCAT